MDKKLWADIGLFVVICNGLSILILFETIVFKIPFITLFIGILTITYKVNLKLFSVRHPREDGDPVENIQFK